MVISLHKTKIKAWKKIVEEKKKEEREREDRKENAQKSIQLGRN
jgi:hypothetical protein